jgi:hypothetical protein
MLFLYLQVRARAFGPRSDLHPCPHYDPNPCHPTPLGCPLGHPLGHPCLALPYEFEPVPSGPTWMSVIVCVTSATRIRTARNTVPIPPPSSAPACDLPIEGEKSDPNLASPANPDPISISPPVQPTPLTSHTSISSCILHQKQRPDYRVLHNPEFKPRDSGKEAASAKIANLVCEIMSDSDPMDSEYPNSITEARASSEWPEWEKVS